MSNRKIDAIITSQKWEICPRLGFMALSQYLYECDLVDNQGVQLSDLKYSERRKELEPRVLGMSVNMSGRDALQSSEIPKNSIAHLRLDGVMRLNDGLSSRGVRSLIADIQAADRNPRISGILLEVDSPGGESASGTALQNALRDVVEAGNTRVGVYAHMIASAAIRGTLPAEFIVAAGGSTDVGSVGTMITMSREILEQIKEDSIDFYARQSTMKSHEWRSLLEGDEEPLIDYLTENAQYFIDEVFEAREIKGSPSLIEQLESGKLFSAGVALELGLIHKIGTFGDAVDMLTADQTLTSPVGDRPGNSLNQSTMSKTKFSLSSFIASITGGLRNQGIEIADDATPEEVAAAINDAPTREDSSELQAQVTEQGEQISTLTETVNQMSEQFNSLIETAQQVAERNEQLETENGELTEANEGLKKEVSKAKGKIGTIANDKTTEKANGKIPNMEDFKTVRRVTESVRPGNGAKYSRNKK